MNQAFNSDPYKRLPGGIRAAVLPMQGADLVHQATLGAALEHIIGHEAAVHEAAFQSQHFHKILKASEKGEINVLFLMAAMHTCLPKLAGAAIELPTVITKWQGNEFKHYPAIYGEDTCVLPEFSKTFREKTAGALYPNGLGLGTWFAKERIEGSVSGRSGFAPLGMVSQGRVCEYSGHNGPMIGLLNKFGATTAPDASAVLELDGLTPTMKSRWQVPVDTEALADQNGKPLDNIFVTRWSGESGKQQIAASFTKTISTFTGDPIVRVQLTSNGNLPNGDMLQNVLSSLLAAGHDEIRERKWAIAGELKSVASNRSPIIPLLASRQQQMAALLSAGRDEILSRRIGMDDLSHIFGGAVPTMRIHALRKPEIVAALKDLGAQPRILGPHVMLPAIMDFANMPQEALNFDLPPARPLNTVNHRGATSTPLFSLAA
ncbi:MAG: hypothetical protein WDO70_00350 [Alphaproteobacteria bacterium]